MKHIILSLSLILLAFLANVQCTRQVTDSPIKMCIFPGDYPDPTIVRDGKDFYMTHTSCNYSPGLLIWHSTDLVNWKPVTRVAEEVPGAIWAPELCKVGDLFYLYYPTASSEVFVVTASDIRGPWSKPSRLGYIGIDPGHVTDNDGRRYIYTNKGRVIGLTPDGLSTEGEQAKVYEAWKYPQEWETECMCLESPKLIKRGEWFYLVSAEGGTAGPATSHMCVVSRSKSAIGPWEDSPHNPLVHTYSDSEAWWSKGHGTLIDDADGNWYIVYHAYLKDFHTLGRSTIIESVEWTADGWPVLSEKDGARWESKGLTGNYDYLRDYGNSLLWTRWNQEFEGGTLYTTTAIDTSYVVTATFFVGENSSAGLYLFYNEKANFGKKTDAPGIHSFRIVNDNNIASLWHKEGDGEWNKLDENVDVSSFHQNNYGSFLALRPSYLLSGDAKLESFDYAPFQN